MEPSELKEVEVEREVSVRRMPLKIVGRDVKQLRNKEVSLVNVQWGEDEANATWEAEDQIRLSY